MEPSSILQRRPGAPQEHPIGRDRAPDSPSLSPIISDAALQELANAPSPPDTFLSQYLLPHQYIAFILPVTLLLGSLFGTINGNRESYFSNKHNILNMLFVKNGWGWTTLVFLVYLAIVYGKALIREEQRTQDRTRTDSGESSAPPRSTAEASQPAVGSPVNSKVPSDVIVRALVRWGLATAYWWIISQWFFGPGLFDRLFVLTGGSCSVNGNWSQHTCRKQGGLWAGGVDISGHMFLLSHAWLFLMEELSIFMNVPEALTAIQSRPAAKYAVLNVAGLCGLWWWMSLMTSVYYHHLAERLTGLFFGMAFWAGTYVTSYKVLPFPSMPDQTVMP
ncbi:hypothetical protein BGZ80_010777 [Entomortierella chlamydospora]|uniref:Uncharacterized protein n=1 Tax=Entomortierella chlamydospora TaxID=101097 RepID=A0A9P6T3Z3_9FUNG|nr:hypothetical protein BGZ79_001693 [Entomortierella chlamydospora]KAG0022940.1 hypothetical protein BGZ80_010777 [Entomortierella chlamydospora]